MYQVFIFRIGIQGEAYYCTLSFTNILEKLYTRQGELGSGIITMQHNGYLHTIVHYICMYAVISNLYIMYIYGLYN